MFSCIKILGLLEIKSNCLVITLWATGASVAAGSETLWATGASVAAGSEMKKINN